MSRIAAAALALARSAFAVAALVLLLSLLAPVGAVPCFAQAASPNAPLRLAPYDVLQVTVLGKPELSRSVMVLPEGKISYPYIGEIQAAGLTIGELTRRITNGLSQQISSPQVTIEITKRRELQPATVGVLGAVHTPGKRTLLEGERVLGLIVDAGGLLSERPEWLSANIIRGGGATVLPVDLTRLLTTGDASVNVPLEAGDVLLLQPTDMSRTHVQVLGEVAKPALVPLPQDGSILSVLTGAGGLTPRASLSHATLIRAGKTINVDLSRVTSDGGASSGIVLQPGDTLIIPPNKQQFAVIGAVSKPGPVDFPDTGPLTVVRALSLVDGMQPGADLNNASLVREARPGTKPVVIPVDLGKLLKGEDASANLAMQPGDVLYVPTKPANDRKFNLLDLLAIIPVIQLLRR